MVRFELVFILLLRGRIEFFDIIIGSILRGIKRVKKKII